MKRGTLCSFCILVLFIWGCPKRQSVTRIVYVPPPPPAPSASAEETGELTIEEPQPPEPEMDLPTEPPPSPEPPAKRRPRRPTPEPADTTEPALDPVGPVELPALEARENPGQQTAQRRQIADLQDRVRARIGHLQRSDLSTQDRRMLEDARTFLTQSERALTASDFQRALNLVRKASMLATVLEQD